MTRHKKQCQRCGYEEFEGSIVLHHITNESYEETGERMYLCFNCHFALHHKRITYDNGIFREWRQGDITPRRKHGQACKQGPIIWVKYVIPRIEPEVIEEDDMYDIGCDDYGDEVACRSTESKQAVRGVVA